MVIFIFIFFFGMNRNTSSSFTPSGGSASSSSSDGPIYAPAPIVLLREAPESEGSSISDIPFILSERDIEHFYDIYQIPQESFHIFAPSPRVRVNDLIPAENTIMVFEEQLKVGLRFPIDPFFIDILRFHKLSVVQLHPNTWRILVAFWFICLNNHIKLSVALFSQLYQLGT